MHESVGLSVFFLLAALRLWRFELISSPEVRQQIRALAEEEERLFYETRITPEWREALAPLGTDWEKPFLEVAPHLIACFKVEPKLRPEQPPPRINAFVREAKLEGAPWGGPPTRPPSCFLPVGYPARGCLDIPKKLLEQILTIC